MLLAPVALCLVPLIWQLPLLLCFEFRASSTCGSNEVKRRCKKKKKFNTTVGRKCENFWGFTCQSHTQDVVKGSD